MLDPIFLTVGDVPASIAFDEQALAPLGIVHVHDDDGADGPPGAHLNDDPRCYAANIFGPGGDSIEVVDKSWQHPEK